VINGAMSLVSNLLDSLLGFSISGDDVIGIVQGFIDDYLTDSFCVGLGGIAKNIGIAFGTDDSTDIANLKDPAEPYELEPCENFALIKDKDTQVVKKAFFLEGKAVGAEQNPATFENNRLPGTMTANFDTKNSTTEFTLSFYTDEEIFAKIQYRKVGDTEWTTASGDHWNIFDEAERETKYATSGIYKDNLFGDVTVGNVNIKTITAPAYIPLIDLGILCITHGQVDYEDADGNTVYYTCRDRDNTPSNTIIFRNRHIVTISGLEANTTYEYNVFGEYYATDGTLKASYSLAGSQGVDHFTFKTAADKSTRTFDILAIADMQGMIQSMYDESANDIAKITDKFGYDFVLNAGDMTDNGKNYYHWQYALNTNVNFFANTSAFNAAGNHEANTYAISNFYNYTQPDSVEFNAIGKAEQDYYSFDYGCAHITVLDTNDASKDGLGATQLEWLKQDLETNKDAEVKFVLMHKSLYSTGSHTMDNDVVAMRAQLVPLFKQYAIDIVFGGHDHVYCEAEVDGTLYVTLGTIGTKFYEYTNDSEEVAAKLNENSINHTLTQRTFGYVKVEDGKVTYQGYTFDENGEIIEIKPEANGKDGLPAWAIALIVVGSVAVAAGIGVGVFFIIKKKKAK
ncbi:MAG: metallophosphoesterase, partial [Clostridia bacterium]|nr:metallophosphoesterase [Clostridia bacterium]